MRTLFGFHYRMLKSVRLCRDFIKAVHSSAVLATKQTGNIMSEFAEDLLYWINEANNGGDAEGREHGAYMARKLAGSAIGTGC